MKLKIDHHIYGKIPKKDFSTLKCTAELSKDEIKKLEQFSQYNLPLSLWDENKRKPPKYIFYNLNNIKIIIGRGIDVGKDEQNRWGNFLFHNIIIDQNEFCRLRLNPVRVIKILEEKNIFLEKFTGSEELSESIEVQLEDKEKIDIDTSIFTAFKDNEVVFSNLFHYCFNHWKINLPFWISGEEKDILKFLDSFFVFLPKSKWSELSLNTFWSYTDEKLPGAYFICTSLIDDQSLPNKYFAKFDLSNKIFERNVNIQEHQPSNYGKLYAGILTKGDNSSIRLLNQLYETAGYSNWKTFIRLFGKLEDDQSKKALFEYWRNKIIHEISNGNIDLFNMVKNFLDDTSLKRIFTSEPFITQLDNAKYSEILDEFEKCFFDSFTYEERKKSYSYILKTHQVYANVIERFNKLTTEKEVEIFFEILQVKLSDRNVDKNEIANLLYIFKKSLDNNTSLVDRVKNKTLRFLKNLESEDFKVRLIKAVISYRMGEEKELLSIIKDKTNLNQMYNLLSSGLNEIFSNNNY